MMIRTLAIAFALGIVTAPAFAHEKPAQCKHECGQTASQCRLMCSGTNRSKCVNACQARFYKCQARCQSGVCP